MVAGPARRQMRKNRRVEIKGLYGIHLHGTHKEGIDIDPSLGNIWGHVSDFGPTKKGTKKKKQKRNEQERSNLQQQEGLSAPAGLATVTQTPSYSNSTNHAHFSLSILLAMAPFFGPNIVTSLWVVVMIAVAVSRTLAHQPAFTHVKVNLS